MPTLIWNWWCVVLNPMLSIRFRCSLLSPDFSFCLIKEYGKVSLWLAGKYSHWFIQESSHMQSNLFPALHPKVGLRFSRIQYCNMSLKKCVNSSQFYWISLLIVTIFYSPFLKREAVTEIGKAERQTVHLNKMCRRNTILSSLVCF